MLCGSEPTRLGGQWFRHRWIAAIGVIALVAAHGVVLTYVLAHTAISMGVVLGLIVLILIKHLGLLGPAYALLRKFLWRDRGS